MNLLNDTRPRSYSFLAACAALLLASACMVGDPNAELPASDGVQELLSDPGFSLTGECFAGPGGELGALFTVPEEEGDELLLYDEDLDPRICEIVNESPADVGAIAYVRNGTTLGQYSCPSLSRVRSDAQRVCSNGYRSLVIYGCYSFNQGGWRYARNWKADCR